MGHRLPPCRQRLKEDISVGKDRVRISGAWTRKCAAIKNLRHQTSEWCNHEDSDPVVNKGWRGVQERISGASVPRGSGDRYHPHVSGCWEGVVPVLKLTQALHPGAAPPSQNTYLKITGKHKRWVNNLAFWSSLPHALSPKARERLQTHAHARTHAHPCMRRDIQTHVPWGIHTRTSLLAKGHTNTLRHSHTHTHASARTHARAHTHTHMVSNMQTHTHIHTDKGT